MRLVALFVAALCIRTALAAPVVALDIGHSLQETGAVSARGVPEFEFNRRLAHAVAAALEEAGVTVKLIGADGRSRDLRERAREAAGVQLLVSIHHDSVQPKYLKRWRRGAELRPYGDRFRGYSLFVSRRNPQEARSLHCAASIGMRLRRAGFSPTRHHAEPMEGESRPWADYAAGVHYFDNLVVLKSAEVPAVLLEAGVIVNRQEERLLGQERYRSRLARTVARGIGACLA